MISRGFFQEHFCISQSVNRADVNTGSSTCMKHSTCTTERGDKCHYLVLVVVAVLVLLKETKASPQLGGRYTCSLQKEKR